MTRARMAITFLLLAPLVGLIVACVQIATGRAGLPEIVVFLVCWSAANVGVFVGSHRLFAHRSFEASRGLRWALAALGSTAGQGPVLWWASTHRLHHAFSEAEGDVHSPRDPNTGAVTPGTFWHGHYGWLFREAPAVAAVLSGPDAHRDGVLARHYRFAPDLFADPVLRAVNRRHAIYNGAGLLLPSLALALWYGTPAGFLQGLVWGGLLRNAVNHHATFLVNSVCHCVGRKQLRSGDEARNVAWLLPFVWGENWHNNHHAFPASARHGLNRFQFDVSWWVIRGMEKLGLVWDVRVPSREQLDRRRLEPA